MTLRRQIAQDMRALHAGRLPTGRRQIRLLTVNVISSPRPLALAVPGLALALLRRDVDDAAPRRRRLGLAPQLVSVALDVVQPVRDHDRVLAQRPLDRRELLRARYLLLRCVVVDFIPETTGAGAGAGRRVDLIGGRCTSLGV